MSDTIIQAKPLKVYGLSGPASALNNGILVFDGTTGKKIKAGTGIICPSSGRLDLSEIRAKDGNGLKLYEDGGSGIFIKDDGKIGIGTTTPDRNLHVESEGDTYFRVTGNRGNANDLHIGNIEFENSYGSNGVVAEIKGITGNTGVQSTMGQLAFWTDDGATYAERVRIKQNGNVGVGTTAPATSAKLDLTSTTGALLLTRMTTAQKNALTAVNGMVLYDSTLNKFQGRESGAWVNLI